MKDLGGFSHLFLIYHFHESDSPRLRVRPFLDRQERRIFATLRHDRPNQIGLSIVELISVNKNSLQIRGVDILDGTRSWTSSPMCGNSISANRSGAGGLMKRFLKLMGRRNTARTSYSHPPQKIKKRN